jgi:hypothetical protein
MGLTPGQIQARDAVNFSHQICKITGKERGRERESENPNKNYVHFLGEEMHDTNVLLQRNNVDD